MAFDPISFGITALGGLLGSQANKDQTQTISKDPWGPAQPYLLDDLKTNQQMQKFYQANPFNQQQKVGLQNTMGDSDNFRSNIMPGLMDFANKGMTSSYQRQTGGAPGSGGGYGGAVVPGGMRQSGTGPFQAPSGGLFGKVDWEANNPFSAQNQPTQQAGQAGMQSGGLLGNNPADRGQEYNGQTGTPEEGNIYGIGSSFNTDMASSVFAKASALGIPAAAISAFIAGISSGHMSKEEIAAEVASLDAALAAKDSRNHGGISGDNSNRSDPGGYGSMADTRND